MPSQAEYLCAFQSLFSQNKINDLHLTLLREQYWSPNHSVSAVELCGILDKPLSTINLSYGSLGHLIADEIGFAPEQRDSGTYRWWKVADFWPVEESADDFIEFVGQQRQEDYLAN